MRRAVVSIPSNIAEGQTRTTSREFIRFLAMAEGSLGEVETQLMIAERLGYIKPKQLEELLEQAAEVARLLKGLMKAIEKRIAALTTKH